MLSGSCLCGCVAYEVDARPGPIVHCHCATCRKAHGSAFSTVSNVPRNRFRWTKGEDLLKGFESSPGKTRYFCSQCGSHIVAAREGKDTFLLRMGCLDTAITERPRVWSSRKVCRACQGVCLLITRFEAATTQKCALLDQVNLVSSAPPAKLNLRGRGEREACRDAGLDRKREY
jgi:hypothetical protein